MGSILLLLALILHYAEGPEEFLQDLCDNRSGAAGALFWAENRTPGEDGAPVEPDSLAPQLALLRDLSVEPGDRTLFENTGDGYIIEYAGSRWSWTGADGRIRSVTGLTVVSWREGDYRWIEVPMLVSSTGRIGPREKLLSGFLFTTIIMVFGVIVVIWARRRYLPGR